MKVIEVVGASPSGQNRLPDAEPFWRSHLESAGSFVGFVFYVACRQAFGRKGHQDQ
jgi:hypothetical protein